MRFTFWLPVILRLGFHFDLSATIFCFFSTELIDENNSLKVVSSVAIELASCQKDFDIGS